MKWIKRAQPWLGTLVEIGLPADATNADAAFDAAFRTSARIHQAMSPKIETSDIARFNHASAGTLIRCDPWTIEVLTLSLQLCAETHGVFDVTRDHSRLDGWALDGAVLIKCLPSCALDLGGIAKGAAVDRACDALRDKDITSGWVNAGGDLRVFGECQMPVYRRDHDHPSQLSPLIEITDGAIATSVFDRAQYPTSVRRQVSIAAPLCIWADALTKIVGFSHQPSPALLARYLATSWTDS